MNKPEYRDLYKFFGVAPDSTAEAIRKAWRKHALMYHPDKIEGSDDAKAKAAQHYEELTKVYKYDVFEFRGYMIQHSERRKITRRVRYSVSSPTRKAAKT
jgi:hypothetical protein